MQTNVKPASPMLAPEQRPSKPPSPLRPKNAPKTPISHPQRRRRFQSRLSRHPQRRHRFQTTGPAGLQGQAAAPVCGGGAWPAFETTHRSATRLHWCGGRRRVRRARAGFEIDHSEPQARVWRSRGRPGPTAPGTPEVPQATPSMTRAAAHRHSKRPGPPAPGTPAAPTTQRNEAATGFPATASSRSRSAVHNSATSNQAVMST